MTTALVTGATAGIGKVFAQRFAARGHDLVLVARNAASLEEVAADLRKRHGVEVETLRADLCDRQQMDRVADRLRDAGRPVDILVNNAGFGLAAPFLQGPISDEERMLDCLVRAVLVLTRAAVPGMIDRRSGTVITVSSVAGFLPGGTYSAAKAWATTFTVSLAGQLAGTGVAATVLCPGYVRTEFQQRAGVDVSYLPGWVWLDAEELVDRCLEDVRRGRMVSVPSLRYKAMVFFLRRFPLRWLKGLAVRRNRMHAAGNKTGDR
ncbi:MAG: SDR family oxidoreductase [Thermodesulfobacteriota bacterium]